ncbi:hypothetical protein ScPMuIL_004035 [Solemya velum]
MLFTGALPASLVSQGQSMHYRCLLLLILGPVLYSVSEACGRTPATPRPTAPPGSAFTTPLPTTPTPRPTHRVNCTASEIASRACLNGGICFVVVLDNKRTASCHCTGMFIGDRCQELTPDIFWPSTKDSGRIATASIAGSIVLLIIVTVVVVVCIVYHYRKKKRSENNTVNLDTKNENYTDATKAELAQMEEKQTFLKPDQHGHTKV